MGKEVLIVKCNMCDWVGIEDEVINKNTHESWYKEEKCPECFELNSIRNVGFGFRREC